jgi:hypothetical protein
MFGGTDLAGHAFSDTWEWDGFTWIARQSAHVPPARFHHAMSYDPISRGVMVFGGTAGDGTPLNDTWEWNGTDWTELLPASLPPLGGWYAMNYDSTFEGRLFLFTTSDVWKWDGNWTAMQTPAPARLDSSRVSGSWLLFATTGSYADPDELWHWDGFRWLALTPKTGLPPARTNTAMAYDAEHATAVLFGGAMAPTSGHDTNTAGDTWLWDGTTWREQQPARSPPARIRHAMAYDAARKTTVLFGGTDPGSQPLNDTWEWDGATWLQRSTAVAPAARSGHAMVYDAARNQTVLLGGIAADQRILGDQWLWDGRQWHNVTPGVLPVPRSELAATYDAARQRVVMFGGYDGLQLLGDVWEWDGLTWTEHTPAGTRPAPRRGHTLIYDAARRRSMLFGGSGPGGSQLGDVWEWDGSEWTSLALASAPAAREGHAMVCDAARGQLVVFGGFDGRRPLRDTWLFRYVDPGRVGEACFSGIDGDGNGKIGCDDPDCAASCTTCGDGVCNAAETSALCPADCDASSVCGDFRCGADDTCSSCPGDCGACPSSTAGS